MWDFARKNWKTNIAFQGGRTTSERLACCSVNRARTRLRLLGGSCRIGAGIRRLNRHDLFAREQVGRWMPHDQLIGLETGEDFDPHSRVSTDLHRSQRQLPALHDKN